MNRIINKKQRKTHYASAKCQYCATYAKTSDEGNEKFGLKQNRERYSRCKNCVNGLCLWKEAYNEKQQEYNKKQNENNKEEISEKIKCNVCNNLIMKCNLKRPQEA